jgi:hypothetical protein
MGFMFPGYFRLDHVTLQLPDTQELPGEGESTQKKFKNPGGEDSGKGHKMGDCRFCISSGTGGPGTPGTQVPSVVRSFLLAKIQYETYING